MKFQKYIIVFLLLLLYLSSFNSSAFAIDGDLNDSYIIYDEYNQEIMEKSAVEVGDSFITPNFEEYEIYLIEGKVAYAKKIGSFQLTKQRNVNEQKNLNANSANQTICLYMTHNDESFVPSDGYDSIYGAGGIHDVAKKLKNQLENKNFSVILDETLHIPHNWSAYSRSGVTATKLYNEYNPIALFDVHRDGVGKSYYYTQQNGEDLSKIRIVVGKSNPNYQKNLEFAKTLFATGNSLYPWLFSDIYSGSGHYNQALKDTCLLFEMGTYMIEKEYVYNSIPYLVDAIDLILGSEENNSTDNGNSIDSNISDNNQTANEDPNTSSNSQNSNDTENTPSTNSTAWIWIILSLAIISSIIAFIVFKNKKSKNTEKVTRKK